MVSLLLGHIQLHGLHQPEKASLSYLEVLKGEPDATIAALAGQGLERCQSEHTASEASTTPSADLPIPDLLKDPFLTTDVDQAKPTQPDVVTAMPWLASDEGPRPIPAPTPAPVPSPQPKVTPEADSSDVEIAKQEPEPTRKEPPLDTIKPTPQEPTPLEPAATDLLEHSWLRVQLKPEKESPTDSREPMGLINRIKGAFARSAGR